MSLLSISQRLTASWLKPDKLSDNKSKVNSENIFKLRKTFTMMSHSSNGIKLQTLESLTHTLFTEKLMLEMDSNLVDGLIHSAGLIPVLMMIKYLFNMMSLASIPQLIMVLVMKKLSISFNSDLMFLKDQPKPITEKMMEVSCQEKHGTGLELDPIKLNFQDGLTHFHGLMKEKVMREFSKEKLSLLMPNQKLLQSEC